MSNKALDKNDIKSKSVGVAERPAIVEDGEISHAEGAFPPLSKSKAIQLVRDLKKAIAINEAATDGLRNLLESFDQTKPVRKRVNRKQEYMDKLAVHFAGRMRRK